VSKCSSGTGGTARAAQRERIPGSTALVGHGGPPELLSGERVPGSTALAGRGGPPELFNGESIPGSKRKSRGAWAYIGAQAVA
jgi:hypothetical protein